MKKRKVLTWIIVCIALAINIFILVNAFISGEKSAAESNKIAHAAADAINVIKPETITTQNFPKFAFSIRKLVGHFGLFAISGIFSSWAIYLLFSFKKSSEFFQCVIPSFLHGLVLAFLSEITQLFIEGRSGNFIDVWIDFSGYFLGFVFILIIFLIIEKKNKHI